jgi:hypothetical protein
MNPENTPERQALEQRATTARNELARTLGTLDLRRHQLTDVRFQFRTHARQLLFLGGAVVLALGGAVLFSVRARRHRGRERFRALTRWWKHPEKVAQEKPQPSVFAELGRKALVTVVTVVAGALARRSLARALPSEEGRAPAQ